MFITAAMLRDWFQIAAAVVILALSIALTMWLPDILHAWWG